MTAGSYLQIVGAACEIGGVVTVAVGIAKTRRSFTDRPSLTSRGWAGVLRAWARVPHPRRRRDAVVNVHAVAALSAVGKARVRATVGFGPWTDEKLEDRIERLRRAFENHERVLNEIDERLDGEETSRREVDERLEKQVSDFNRELRELIREAAAGGLRLETIGVVLFALGIVLGTWGNLIR